jgi:hypothetical protein
VRLHSSAAACTAVADGVEAAQHGILEKGVVDVAALVLSAQDVHSLAGRNPSGTTAVVLDNEAGKRLPNDQANIQRQTRLRPRGATGTLERYNVIRVLHHNIASQSIGDHVLQVS